jgi:hypothetical protein
MDASCAIVNYPKNCFAKQGGIFFLAKQHFQLDLESCVFNVTFTTWLIQRKDIVLG